MYKYLVILSILIIIFIIYSNPQTTDTPIKNTHSDLYTALSNINIPYRYNTNNNFINIFIPEHTSNIIETMNTNNFTHIKNDINLRFKHNITNKYVTIIPDNYII